jgi:acetyl esterase
MTLSPGNGTPRSRNRRPDSWGRLWQSLPASRQTIALKIVTALPAVAKAALVSSPLERAGQVMDRDAQFLLAAQRLAADPPLEISGLQDARRRIEVAAAAGASRSRRLASAEPLVLLGGSHPIPARWYVPRRVPRFDGLVAYFHGGGFVAGSLETHDDVCRRLAHSSRCSVVSVAYRLAPEHQFPAAVHDAHQAFADLVRIARTLGADPARIAVAGDSAGGNLAAHVAARPSLTYRRPACQLLVYPWLDFRSDSPSSRLFEEGFGLTRLELKWYRELYFPPGIAITEAACSPLYASDLSGAAPAYILTAGFDPLRDDGERYAERLCAAGVDVTVHRETGLTHGFVEALAFSSVGRAAIADAGRTIRSMLLAQS